VNYTRKSCQYDCVARALKEKCNCLPPADRSLYNNTVLNETKRFCMRHDLTCIRDQVHGDKRTTDQIAICRDQCNVPCGDWRYDVRATSTDLYKPAFMPYQVMPDITYILVSYSFMEYTQVTQSEATTFDEFVANVGGEVGLWVTF